jgi:hypothetical protein
MSNKKERIRLKRAQQKILNWKDTLQAIEEGQYLANNPNAKTYSSFEAYAKSVSV